MFDWCHRFVVVPLITVVLGIGSIISLGADSSVSKAVVNVENSIVQIKPHLSSNPALTCTGFVIQPRQVITANHCASKSMTIDGVPVMLIKSDVKVDLALYSVPNTTKSVATLATSITRFQAAYGVGYAFGFNTPYITLNRVILVEYNPKEFNMAPGIFVEGKFINGMSGGPFVNSDGEVLGIVQRSYEGVGYGVSTKTIQAFLNSTPEKTTE